MSIIKPYYELLILTVISKINIMLNFLNFHREGSSLHRTEPKEVKLARKVFPPLLHEMRCVCSYSLTVAAVVEKGLSTQTRLWRKKQQELGTS